MTRASSCSFLSRLGSSACSWPSSACFAGSRRPAAWCFFAGMAALGLDSIFTGLSLRATQLGEVVDWLTPAFVVKSVHPRASGSASA